MIQKEQQLRIRTGIAKQQNTIFSTDKLAQLKQRNLEVYSTRFIRCKKKILYM